MIEHQPMAASSLFQGSTAKSALAPGLSVLARLVELCLVAFLAFLAAQAVWFVVYGDAVRPIDVDSQSGLSGGAGTRVTDMSVLTQSGLFATREQVADAGPQIAPETRLNLTLRGVRSGADARSGAAFIEAPGRGQGSYAAGDEIANGVRLEEIYEDRVIINRGGSRESLFISPEAAERARANAAASAQRPSSAGATQSPSGSQGVEADAELARSLSVEDWVDGLRLAPRMIDGEVAGLRVRPNSQAEILRAAGLQVGDVITALNGQPLTSLEAAQRALSTLETRDRLSLSLERDGAPVQIDVPLN